MNRKLKFPALRRPSPAMGVALVALFLSLGGAGYAAVTLPNGSVGSSQLKNFAVTNPKIANSSIGYRKIMPGAVGTVRIDKNDVQLRVTGTCTGQNQAINTITVNGGTTCASTDPTETDTGAGTTTALTSTAATLATFSLSGGSEYMVQADPYITVTANKDTSQQTVSVSCTLAAGTTATQTRTATLVVPSSDTSASTSIPLTVVAPESANAETADVTCTGTATDATLDGQATVYSIAIQAPSSTTTTATAS